MMVGSGGEFPSLPLEVPSLPLEPWGGPECAGLDDQESIFCSILVLHEPLSIRKDIFLSSYSSHFPFEYCGLGAACVCPQCGNTNSLHGAFCGAENVEVRLSVFSLNESHPVAMSSHNENIDNWCHISWASLCDPPRCWVTPEPMTTSIFSPDFIFFFS